MPLSQSFIAERALHTIAAQQNVAADWVWARKSLAEWEADVAAFQTKQEEVSRANALMAGRRGAMKSALKGLHGLTVVYLTLLKALFRQFDVSSSLLAPLTAAGGGCNRILDEARTLRDVWREIDPGWEPRPGKTLTGFGMLIESTALLKEEFREANTAWRNRAGELRALAAALNEDCVAWYASAMVVFPAETAESAMIRGCVPTTYRKSKASKKEKVLA